MLHTRFKALNRPDPRDCLDQVDRVIESPLLQGSEALCRLLRYMAEHTLNSPKEHLKEYQIATEVLGRLPDFDPHADSSVRVQVGRLRNKLAQYFSSFGEQDPILIEIPKGRYTLSFQDRTPYPEPVTPIQLLPTPALSTQGRRTRLVKGALTALVVLAALTMGSLFSISRQKRISSAVRSGSVASQPQSSLERFWGPFLHGPQEPFVVFKNASFVGDAQTGMRRFNPARDNPSQLVEHYTGIGEVMGVLELDQVFHRFGSQFRVKRAGLFTVDDARDNNLIFVGSPGKNLSPAEIPGTQEFTLRKLANGPYKLKRAVIDNHPRSAATAVYAADVGTHPVKVEFAIVALVRGLDPNHWTLFLEGTSTVATQAAVDFVSNESSVSALMDHLHVSSSAGLKPFEGLLRVKTANDVPVETQLIDLRTTQR